MKYMSSLCLFGLLAGLGLGCTNKNAPRGDDRPTDPAVAPAAANSETAEEELKRLAGTWQIASIQNLPPGYSSEIKHLTARVEGKMIELGEGGLGYFDHGEIRLDPTKSPKQFDLIALDKTGKPQTIKYSTTGGPNDGKQLERPVEPVQGIYSLKGDRLTIALTDRDGYRPPEFKASVMEQTGGFVTVNRRGSTYVVIVELVRVTANTPKVEPDESRPEGVARMFMAAFRSRDVDGVLKVSTAPFLIELDDPKNAKLIEKPGELKAELQKLIDGWPKLDEFPTGIVEYGEWGHKGVPREQLEKANNLQDKVRDYGGHYIIPRIAAGPDKGERANMKLRLKDVAGKPRVVGLVTGEGSYPY